MSEKTKINELDDILRTYCRPLYLRLSPPLELSEIKSYFQKWNIDDPILMEIFTWKNGIPYDMLLPTYSFDFTGFGVIPTLAYIDEIIKLENSDKSWRKSLFPLVVSFAGDFLLYETDKSNKNYGQLFLYSPNLGYVDFQVGYFDSLVTMIDTIKECFERKVFVYNYEEMSLDIVDYTLRSEIAKAHNPISEYWEDA